MELNPEYYLRVFLVFVRISGVFLSAPVFSHPSVPVRLRVLLSIVLAYALVGFVPGPLPEGAETGPGFILAVALEAVTGVTIGFAGQFVFMAIGFAGHILGFQIGLALAETYDPINGANSNPIGQFLALIFLLVFLLLDGHHHILTAMVTSFQVIPLAGARIEAVGPTLLAWTGGFFVIAIRLASPFMITIFLVDAALGVFARVAPQADLFSIGLPLKLLGGIALSLAFMQYFFPFAPELVSRLLSDVMELIEVLAMG